MSINATLIAQIIVFAILVWFTMKFVWPPLTQALEDRRKKIAEGLASAERGEHELELAQKKASEILREARQQASEIVEQANRRGNDLVEEARDTARHEAERIVASGHAQVEQELVQARGELSSKLGSLALTAAANILGREVDEAAHKGMLENLAKQL